MEADLDFRQLTGQIVGMAKDMLQKRGYKPDAIRGIMHGNWVRFFRQALPKK